MLKGDFSFYKGRPEIDCPWCGTPRALRGVNDYCAACGHSVDESKERCTCIVCQPNQPRPPWDRYAARG